MQSIDLVVSGINAGLNVGRDVFYSGTVGAAITARLMGKPAIAVSLDNGSNGVRHFETAGMPCRRAAGIRRQTAGRPGVINLNVPNLPLAQLGRHGHDAERLVMRQRLSDRNFWRGQLAVCTASIKRQRLARPRHRCLGSRQRLSVGDVAATVSGFAAHRSTAGCPPQRHCALVFGDRTVPAAGFTHVRSRSTTTMGFPCRNRFLAVNPGDQTQISSLSCNGVTVMPLVYAGKYLRIDLTTETVSEHAIDDDDVRAF